MPAFCPAPLRPATQDAQTATPTVLEQPMPFWSETVRQVVVE